MTISTLDVHIMESQEKGGKGCGQISTILLSAQVQLLIVYLKNWWCDLDAVPECELLV